jgi:acyl dehydratase
MAAVTYDALQEGSEIPPFQSAPISRHTLALYCGASGDHNPIHVDTDFAKAAGYDDVFAHGMLSMAYMGRLLTNWVPPTAIRKMGVRFSAITQVHDVVTCTGKVLEKSEADGEKRIRLELSATTQDGTQTLKGEAVVVLP